MKTNYTKGPWIAKRWTNYAGDHHIESEEEGIIAHVTGRGGDFAEKDTANARLIASAPDMFEALIADLEWNRADDLLDAHMNSDADCSTEELEKEYHDRLNMLYDDCDAKAQIAIRLRNSAIARATTPTTEGGL